MQKGSRRWFGVFAVILALAVTVPSAADEEQQPSTDNVAIVNGSPITRADFDMEVKRLERRMLTGHAAGSSAGQMDIKDKVLDNLIDLELLYQDSRKNNIEVDNAEIDKRLSAMKERFPGEKEFADAISKEGLTEGTLRSQIERQLAIEALIEKQIVQKTNVSEEEMKAYYDENLEFFKHPEQIRASHILIKVEPNADDAQKAEARKQIEDIKKKLEEGGDFAELAKQFSQCPSNVKGGDLGYFGRGQMVKPFEEAAFALEPGQMSDVVETQFGYHLIKLTERKTAGTVPYDDVKGRLGQFLKQKKIQQAITDHVEELKKEAKIERFLAKTPAETP